MADQQDENYKEKEEKTRCRTRDWRWRMDEGQKDETWQVTKKATSKLKKTCKPIKKQENIRGERIRTMKNDENN